MLSSPSRRMKVPCCRDVAFPDNKAGLVINVSSGAGLFTLRYLVGDDARGFVRARRMMDDQAYVDVMREHFA